MTRRDRSKRTTAYIATLPPQERGVLLLLLWLNAMVTLTLEAIQLLLIARAVRRSVRSRRPWSTAMDSAESPSTATVLTASAAHRLARDLLMRRLDQAARLVEPNKTPPPIP